MKRQARGMRKLVSRHRFGRLNRQRLLQTLLPTLTILVIGFWTERVASEECNSSVVANETSYNVENSFNFDGSVVTRTNTTNSVPADALLFPWFVQLLGCCVVFLLTQYNLPVPYAAVMFVLGALMGYLAVLENQLESEDTRRYLQDSILVWTNIDSSTLLLVFLPGLIFKDAVEIPINLFFVAAVQIWILAFPMVLVGTILTAVAGVYCLPYEWEDPSSFGWFAWLVLGAILSSTDPIAVASVLKTAGASPRLVMHIAGESLLNDGSSYVFFMIFSQLWYDSLGLEVQMDLGTVGKSLSYLFQMSVGGSLVGAMFGFGLLMVLLVLDRKLERDFDIIQVVFGLTTAYLCYYVCDQIIGMSGVIATVTCGIVVNRFGRGLIHDKEQMSSYLALADFLLNTLLFALGGVIWAAISFSNQKSRSINPVDICYLLVFYVLCTIIRFIQVGMFYPILSRIGLKSNWKEGIFLAFGGLHGSVGVALGLSLIQYVFQHTDDIEIRSAATILQFLGGGATLLTLTINGTSAGAVLRLLGLVKPPISAEYVEQIFEGAAKDFVYNEMAKLLNEKRFRNVSFDVLREHVPFASKEPPKLYNSTQGDGNLDTTIQKFHQRVVGHGQPYISLLNATIHASRQSLDLPNQREEVKTELLVEMRQIFLELLREAYKLQEEMGELDDQHKGYLFDILTQSVDLSINEVRYDNRRIEDWQHTGIFFQWEQMIVGRRDSLDTASASKEIEQQNKKNLLEEKNDECSTKPRISTVSVAKSLLSVLSLEGKKENQDKKRTQVTMKRIRLDVLRALAFQHGHKMAEAKLRFYVNRFDNDNDESMRARHLVSEGTLETIISESCDQVALAEEMLQEQVSDSDIEIMLSHYCAKIVVRRLQRFTEEKSREGMIGKKETRTHLRKIKDALSQINSKTMERLAESRPSSALKADDGGISIKPFAELFEAPSGLGKSTISDLESDDNDIGHGQESWVGDPDNCF